MSPNGGVAGGEVLIGITAALLSYVVGVRHVRRRSKQRSDSARITEATPAATD